VVNVAHRPIVESIRRVAAHRTSFCELIATGEIGCRADLTDDTRASGDCRLLYTKEEPCAPSPIRPDRKPTAVA
jgi:hypothetical protein